MSSLFYLISEVLGIIVSFSWCNNIIIVESDLWAYEVSFDYFLYFCVCLKVIVIKRWKLFQMQHCFMISPCHGLNSNCIVVPYFSPMPFLFLISNQTRSLWWLLDQMWHIMYFIWWNHSSTCAWIHSWLDLICLGDVCNSDSGLTSHLGRQFFFRGQPRACEMWSVTGMTTVRFICQMGTRLGMFFRSRTGPIFSSKAAQCLQLGANRIFLSLWKTSARPLSPGELQLDAQQGINHSWGPEM